MEKGGAGRKVWVFPDGEIPLPGSKEPYGHESLIIVNTGKARAEIDVMVYFDDKEPSRGIKVSVEGEKVRCFRLDKGIGDEKKVMIPVQKQYALKLESTVPVVAQIGRLDITQPNMAYYTVMGYAQ